MVVVNAILVSYSRHLDVMYVESKEQCFDLCLTRDNCKGVKFNALERECSLQTSLGTDRFQIATNGTSSAYKCSEKESVPIGLGVPFAKEIYKSLFSLIFKRP